MKRPHRRQFLHLAAGVAALPAVSRIASAQTYPTRPVRVIVPYAPGAATDVIARLIVQKLSERLGKQFYVENIGGGGGNIGMGRAAQAAPDGYTMLFASFQFVVNPALYGKVPYGPIKSFEPVTLAASTTVLLAVNPVVPARTVEDLIALIKANPGKYNYASGGGVEPRDTWLASSSACRSVSTFRTSHSTARIWRSGRRSRAIRRLRSSRRQRQ